MKYIDADLLRKEVEKHIKEVKDAAERFTPNMGFFDAKLSGIYDVINIIDSFQQNQQMLKDAVGGTVHHALNCHYIITDQKALNARLRGIPEGTVVNIFICKAEEDQQ